MAVELAEQKHLFKAGFRWSCPKCSLTSFAVYETKERAVEMESIHRQAWHRLASSSEPSPQTEPRSQE